MILRPGVYLQNRYEIIEVIGSGGMSEVYRARCHKLNRFVAIKVLKKEFCSDEEFVRKFKMEAQAAGALNHPNIVNIYDVVDEEELHYIVMELVDGITLKEYISQKGHLGSAEAVGLAIQVAQGIGAAHQRRIIHRDIKPQNMILSEDGKVKVADFGIARAVSAQTMSSQAMGSVHYISPEQARGEFTDERSDIYSLGITMYEMVTGRLPFNGDTAVSVALQHIDGEITPPSVYNPEIPAGLEKIILKCTEKEPDDRYESVDMLISDLRHVIDYPDEIPAGVLGTGASGETRKISRREIKEIREAGPSRRKKAAPVKETVDVDTGLNRLLTGTGLLILIAAAAAVIFFLYQFTNVFGVRTPSPAETTAAQESESSSAISDKEVFTPYIIGLSESGADAKARENDLTLTVAGSDYSDQFAKGLVMDQYPAPGDITPRFTKVEVTLSLGPEIIKINELGLTRLTKEEAISTLEGLGLSVELDSANSDSVAEGSIVRVDPEEAKPGGTVTLTISEGPAVVQTKVPGLVGTKEEDAVKALTAAQLTAGKIGRVYSDTIPAGQVISQGLSEGTELDSGSAVPFIVSLGPENGSTASTEGDLIVEPLGGDSNYKYVASIDNTFSLTNLIGPGSNTTSVNVMIRLSQDVNGSRVVRTLMEPRTVTGDTILPVRFRAIEGAFGVDTGRVEVVNADTDEVLKSYEVQFFKVQ